MKMSRVDLEYGQFHSAEFNYIRMIMKFYKKLSLYQNIYRLKISNLNRSDVFNLLKKNISIQI